MLYFRYSFTRHKVIDTHTKRYILDKSVMTMYSKANYTEVLGNSSGMSKSDISRINKHYSCHQLFNSTPKATTNLFKTQLSSSIKKNIFYDNHFNSSAISIQLDLELVITILEIVLIYIYWSSFVSSTRSSRIQRSIQNPHKHLRWSSFLDVSYILHFWLGFKYTSGNYITFSILKTSFNNFPKVKSVTLRRVIRSIYL